MEDVAERARTAARKLQSLDSASKNRALEAVAQLLIAERDAVFAANRKDVEAARAAGDISEALMRRLELSESKYDALVTGLRDVVALADPVGRVELATALDDGGFNLYRVACPVGVVCVIFEARPEVVIQISALALKSGNAVLLKGGKEAAESNQALVSLFRRAVASVTQSNAGDGDTGGVIDDGGGAVPADVVQLVETRQQVAALLALDQFIDLVIPRGSKALVRHVQSNTRIPVLGHADGLCSVYVDRQADADLAAAVVADAKLNAPSACNSVETLLVHSAALETVLPTVASRLLQAGAQLRADERALPVVQRVHEATARGSVAAAQDADFDTEFLDTILAIRTVDSLEQAVAHISKHGSGHTDCIVTSSNLAAEQFMAQIDSAGVYHNCSTRFADGFRYGFGAEIGVSTNRTHARGPVGVEGLMIYKYRLYGSGQTVESYQNKQKTFKHKPIDLVLPNKKKQR